MDTTIDHIITNKTQKIASHELKREGSSDHRMIQIIWKLKEKHNHAHYFLTHNLKKIDWPQVNAEIFTNPKMKELAENENLDELTEGVQENINSTLEKHAPVKKTQYKAKLPVFASPETRQILDDRDRALERMKLDKSLDTERKFKHLRNICHKLLKTDKTNYIKEKFNKAENTFFFGKPLNRHWVGRQHHHHNF